MNYKEEGDEVLRDLFLERIQLIARELGQPVPTELIAKGLEGKPEKLIEVNISDACKVHIPTHDGLLVVHKSVANTIHKILGTEETSEELHDSESVNIFMDPFLKELYRRLRRLDPNTIEVIGIAA